MKLYYEDFLIAHAIELCTLAQRCTGIEGVSSNLESSAEFSQHQSEIL